MSQIIEDWAEVRGVSVDQVRARLILEFGSKDKKENFKRFLEKVRTSHFTS